MQTYRLTYILDVYLPQARGAAELGKNTKWNEPNVFTRGSYLLCRNGLHFNLRISLDSLH